MTKNFGKLLVVSFVNNWQNVFYYVSVIIGKT
jgi:hypothetical protein